MLLRVTTVIGDLRAVASADDLHEATTLALQPQDQHVASLSMNAALGDTSLLMSPSFAASKEYCELHSNAVAQARLIRQETVTLLATIVKELEDWLKKIP